MFAVLQRGSLKRTRSPIGLDVQPIGARAAQLVTEGNVLRIARVTGWKSRNGESGPELSAGFVQRVARSLVQDGFKGRSLVAGLSSPDVELHAMEIPCEGEMQDEEKFSEAVRWELERVATLSGGDTVTSSWLLPKSRAVRTTAIGAIASAERVRAIDTLANAIGRDCERVDSTACALARLGAVIRRNPQHRVGDIWSVLDVGGRLLRLVVVIDDTPILVRTLSEGGESWTGEIASSLGISEENAEFHKHDHGIVKPGEAHDEAQARISTMIFDIVKPALIRVVDEIERSYEYAMRCFPDRAAGGVIVVGGGANLKGLDRFLARKLGVAVTTLDDIVREPDATLAVQPSQKLSINEFGCAIGLAIRPEDEA